MTSDYDAKMPNGGVDVARAATHKLKETTQRDNNVAARAHVQ
ncbi:MAG TPA: hypothetical protein VK308_08160 [Pyrinomonadaceae bacterium]|nr:hypothetical protein [Pyrinomonadaceae bacterium]